MAEIKTKANTRTVADFMATASHPVRRADTEILIPTMERISGAAATDVGSVDHRFRQLPLQI